MSTPRRSTRSKNNPFPTPSSRDTSNPNSTSTSPDIKDHIPVTPNSMTTDDAPTPSTRSKRKVMDSSLSPEPVPRKRQVLEVSLPAPRRSKLGTEKTNSADNLTLASSSSSKPKPTTQTELIDLTDDKPSVDEYDSDATEVDVYERPRPTRSAAAAKPNYVLELSDSDETEDDMPRRNSRGRANGKAPSAKANGKGKGKKKAVVVDDSSDEFELDDEEDDFAMNSDDEEDQVRAAVERSKADVSTPSPASSSSSRRGKGKKVTAHTLGGKTHKSNTPHRAALARAAELRARGTRDPTLESPDGSGFASPLTSGSSTPFADRIGGSEDDYSLSPSDFSDLSDAEESDGSDSDSDTPPLSSKQKGKAKAKGKKKAAAKGQRLDGGEADEMPEAWRGVSKQQRKALKEEAHRLKEEKSFIKRKENELKKQLDRKLTQGEKNQIRLQLHHPELVDAWGDLEANVERVKPVPMEAHPSLKLTLLPFQKESLFWMKKQEEGPWKGGMLADEMGMGKTIQTIALLLSEPRYKPSLVVAPVVALMQWKNEIETHAEGFSVCLWHGSGRMKAEQLKKFDVVLVSYGTLEASFRRQQNGFKKGNLIVTEKSPMHAFEWYRVVLDEAHNIKERSTNAAKAAFALKAKYRWCLSGTPLQNRVGELYSLVRFLGADPFSYYFCKKCDCKSLHWQFKDKRSCDDCGHSPMNHVSLWNSEILTPIARYGIEAGGPGKTAFKKLKILLDRMMLRRTKLERADDLGLPPRTIVVRRDYFSPPEKELYLSLFTTARRQFDTYVTQGTILNNYSNVFSLITRMRQMACHPDLVLRSKTSSLGLQVSEGTVCRICNDTAEDAIVSACKHVFDRECVRQYLEVTQNRGHPPECPVCHIEISIDLEQEAVEIDDSPKKARQGILSRLDLNNWRSSSKLEALVEELEKLRRKDRTTKSLVFSQFVSFLDLIAFRLQRAGFNICRLEGGMTPQQRNATIQHFMNNPTVTVFLISLKAGGVALNLTEASTVFMMDSWWNPSVEYQAMDRIHRLGQKRPVRVVKLVVEDSIEDQIVQLQAKKLAMTDAALSRDPDAALGKLTVEDLGFLFKL